jgi:hypothetical protein
MRIFGTISKVAPQADGSIRVHGVASSEAKDRHGEIVLASAIADALPDFFRHGTGALREMHSAARAAGTVDEVEVGEDNITRIIATVVDSEAIKKVKTKVYKAYSIGGRVLARDPDNKKIVTAIELSEISLVDVPANPESVLELFKAVSVAAPDGVTDNRLGKVLADRSRLTKMVADRDRAFLDLATRAEAMAGKIAGIASENADLKKQLAELQKPAVLAVDNGARQTLEKKAVGALATLERLEAIVPREAARLDSLIAARGAPSQHRYRLDA